MFTKIATWLHSAAIQHYKSTLKGIIGGLVAASVTWYLDSLTTPGTSLTWHSYVAFALPAIIGLCKKDGLGWLFGQSN